MISITPEIARRIAVYRQRLSGPQPKADLEGVRQVLREIRCLQIDPIRAVERTQYLVLFSRLGNYPVTLLDKLAYQEKYLFEYWAHAASYVLVEDYALHRHMMENIQYSGGAVGQRYKKWLEANQALRQHILDTIRENGETHPSEIEEIAARDWESTGWTSGRNTTLMISDLWDHGELLVARREGNKKYWDLPERVLPEEVLKRKLPVEEIVLRAAQLALRALGVGTAAHIKKHFIRYRYPDLDAALDRLERDGQVRRVAIEDPEKNWGAAGAWYIHSEDLPLIDFLRGSGWQPRTTLLSPFDNLICDRDRTELMWDFHFRIEIYVPKAKRRWGYYVLPILHGDRMIGRIDPLMDRKKGVLRINAVHAEPQAADDLQTVRAIRSAIDQLAAFLGAERVEFNGPLPQSWEKLAA